MPKKASTSEPQGIVGDIIDDKVKSIRRRIRNGLKVEEIIERLTSRKFWLTVAVLAYFMWRGLNSDDDAVAIFGYLTQVIIAFLAIQGGSDALTKVLEIRETGKSTESFNKGELDSNVITAPMNSAMNIVKDQVTSNTPEGD